MQFFIIATTFFAAAMAAPSAKAAADTSVTTVGQAAEACGVNQKVACCNGDDAASCSPVHAGLELIPIGKVCSATAKPKCCTSTNTGLLNLDLSCVDLLSDFALLGAN